MQRGIIQNHQTLLIWNNHRTFYSLLNIKVNLKGNESVLTRLFSPHQTWSKFFPPEKCKEKSPSLFPFSVFIPEPLFLPLLSSFFLLQLCKMPPSTSKTSPINTPHSHEVSFSLYIYSFASPPRIHMDSWWAARNLNQGPKWTQNIAPDRSRAYGPQPCRIWAPKSPKSVLYTSWPNESVELVANWSSWLRKN